MAKFTDLGYMICPRCGANNEQSPIITSKGDHYECSVCLFNWVDEIQLEVT
jgi:transposase-like protein